MQEFLNKGARLRAVFDIDRQFTDPELIDELCTIPGDVECRLYAPRIRRANASESVRAFHPKVYYFEHAGSAAAVVGSGNLTVGGLRTNHEVSILLKGSANDVVLTKLRDQLESIWQSPLLIAVDQYEAFREGYAQAYGRAKQRIREKGIPEETPLLHVDEDVDRLGQLLDRVRRESSESLIAYLWGLLAGGFDGLDSRKRQISIKLRRGVLNRGKRYAGKVFFKGVSERNLSQTECVHRDAQRIVSRLQSSFKQLELSDNAEVRPAKMSSLAYNIVLTFDTESPVWSYLVQQIGDHPRLYAWPKGLQLAKPGIRRAFLQGYMDLRTRIAATDALPRSFMRIAVSVGKAAPRFAERFQKLLADDFGCRREDIGLLKGTARNREHLIRIDPDLVPKSFLQSHWQRIVVDDFRVFNKGLRHPKGAAGSGRGS